MLNYDFFAGDHFNKVSAEARLLYIHFNFYANAGFVPNPKQICKSLGFEESTIDELLSINEIMSIPDRSEIFITSYFIHNPNFNALAWTKTPYFTYWKGKLWMKKNRIATFSKDKAEQSMDESLEDSKPITRKKMKDPTLPNSAPDLNPIDSVINIVDTSELDDDDPF